MRNCYPTPIFKFLQAFLYVCSILSSVEAQQVETEELTQSAKSVRYLHPNREALSILRERCLSCHNERKTEGGYDVSKLDSLHRAGDSGMPVIDPGRPSKSELIRRICHEDPSIRMPSESEKLTDREIRVLTQWIENSPSDPEPNSASIIGLIEGCDSVLELTGPPIERVYTRIPYPHFAVNLVRNRVYVAGFHEVIERDLESQLLLRRWTGLGRQVSAICVDGTGNYIAIASGNPGRSGTIHIVDARAPEIAQQLAAWSDLPVAMSFSPEHPNLVVGGMDGSISLFDVETRSKRFEAAAHSDQVLAISWDAAGSKWISGSRDRTARSYDAKSLELIASYSGHERTVGAVAWLESAVATVDETGTLRIWSATESDKLLTKHSGLPQRLQAISCNANSITWLNQDHWESAKFTVREEIDKPKTSEDAEKEKNSESIKKKKIFELKVQHSIRMPAKTCVHWMHLPTDDSILMSTRDGWFCRVSKDHVVSSTDQKAVSLWQAYPIKPDWNPSNE